MNKRLIKSLIDGVVHSLMFILLGIFCLILPTEYGLLAGALCAIPSAILYGVLARKETGNKGLVSFSAMSMLWFVLCVVIFLIIRITFKFHFIYVPEENNAAGIVILLAQGCYILSSALLRTCCLVALIIKNLKHNKRTEDGSLS